MADPLWPIWKSERSDKPKLGPFAVFSTKIETKEYLTWEALLYSIPVVCFQDLNWSQSVTLSCLLSLEASPSPSSPLIFPGQHWACCSSLSHFWAQPEPSHHTKKLKSSMQGHHQNAWSWHLADMCIQKIWRCCTVDLRGLSVLSKLGKVRKHPSALQSLRELEHNLQDYKMLHLYYL